jgi:hypothetical protein
MIFRFDEINENIGAKVPPPLGAEGAAGAVPECRRRLISMRLPHCTPNHSAGDRCVKLPQLPLPNVQNPADTFRRGLIVYRCSTSMDRRAMASA